MLVAAHAGKKSSIGGQFDVDQRGWRANPCFLHTVADIKDHRRTLPVNDGRDLAVSGERYALHTISAKGQFFTIAGVADPPRIHVAGLVEGHHAVACSHAGLVGDDREVHDRVWVQPSP